MGCRHTMHSHSSKKTIKLNSFYLDNTKNINLGTTSTNLASTPTAVKTSIYKENINNMYHLQAREKRRQRKIYLKNKRSKIMNTTSKVPNLSNNIVPQTENVNSFNSPRIQNTTVQYSHSFTDVRTPLSNITNVRNPLSNITNDNIGFDKYVTSKLPDKRQYYVLSNDMTSKNASTISASSSSIKLNSGCHKLKRKTTHLSPIPLIDLTENVENIDQLINENLILGISNEYLDRGDQNVVCQTCHAKLWRNESIRGKEKGNTDYSLCCGYGKVQLPDLKKAPPGYERMFRNMDSKSKIFMKNIRRYNSMFSFTSMGGKIDSSINRGNAPYIFRLGGQNYHSIGSLIPAKGSLPKFSQLYIYDTENEISNRQRCFGGEKDQSTTIDSDIIQDIKVMLDSNNVLVRSYMMVRDTFQKNPQVDMKLRLIGRRERDGRTYNLPTASEVAALIRDIVVETKTGFLQRISELHPSYLPLQYPLLFPYGDDGYSVDILHRGLSFTTNSKRAKCTMREYFAFRIQDRDHSFSLILNSKRLFQQFLVNVYTMIETERLHYIRRQQHVLRCESYENLRKQKAQGSTKVSNVGQRVILPSSFTGGARYMLQNYLDAMSLCKWFGYPDFFITFTCNPKWPEIKRILHFNQKTGLIYYVGLPHSHICLFMHSDNKLPTVELIDPIIYAEIPDKIEESELYSLVNEFMIHGTCGAENINCPCMVDKKCSKNFPKQFCHHSFVDENGFPLYRRRNDGHFVEKSGVKLDNRNVVPYNKYLLKRYQAHINVEWCNQGSSIKYLFKYINKGPDRATVAVVPTNNECENNDTLNITIVDIYLHVKHHGEFFHIMYPSMVRLPFHLPNQQQIVYGEDDDIDDVLDKPSVAASKFTAWMECNAINSEARELTYVEFPTKFVWVLEEKESRKSHWSNSFVKGPTSFDEIRTVNGETYSSFRDTCYALGLLDDDKEYIDAIKEASHSGSDLSLGEDEVKNLTLFEIEQILLRNNSTLKNFTKMPYPDVESLSSSNNRLIIEELDYDIPVMKNEFDHMFLALTNEQRNIFLNIMSVVKENKGGVFFVYGYGGTGKTFLWKTISAAIRSDGNIVLNVASSGITSLLLPDGRIAHSRFILPFELTEDSFCKINLDGDLANLLRKTSLIIWDEAPMIHKHAFEALDRTLKDVLRCGNSSISNIPFGGKVIVFGRDFRQILPVVPGEGKLGGPNDGETIIDIPNDILINDPDDPIGSLIEFVYPSILEKYSSTNYFQERAILAPKNEVVQEINDRLLKKFPGDEVEYLSSDSLCQSEFVHDQFDANLYSPDVLNGLKVSGLPNHKLVLKIGVPVMLLRNIDQKNSLCNGTRLQVISLGKRVIEARIMSGTNIGNRTFIPRISLTPSEKKIPFKFTRRQFPLASQGQSLSKVGLFLKDPVFSHGQLYVALSRVQSREGLKLLILDKDGRLTNKTSNVVYKEVFRNL
uniref:ATP-dependent DNA helicase n=1 Tax=Lactuca sativa TaxID=4236 RepID=A0A9R1XUL6_LACSA|nr:hypothetical protein LSAT_V11C100049790 [Lactuca sativa]